MVTDDPRCVVCKGLVGDGPDLMPSVLVSFEGITEEVCDLCVEKADPEIHPDYTDLNPEGDPTRNGAFA